MLDTHARQGDVKGATKVWEMMNEDHRLGNTNIKPNVQTYNIIIDAWSKSGDKKAPVESERNLKEMNNGYEIGELQERPDNITYRTMIRCLKRFKETEDRARELKAMALKMDL